jgi:hypothetical protein
MIDHTGRQLPHTRVDLADEGRENMPEEAQQ